MIYMNESMKQKFGVQDNERRYCNLPEKIVSKTKILSGFIVYDEHGKRNYSKSNIENAIKNAYCDGTGFEATMNDVDIDFKDLNASEIETFLLDLNDALVKKFNHKMAIYIFTRVCLEDDFTETEMPIWNIRFHSLWDGEPLWLVPDLNVYHNATACFLADEKWLTMERYPKKEDTSGQ